MADKYFIDEKQYHTLREGIPLKSSNSTNAVGMDTVGGIFGRALPCGIHLWIGHHEIRPVGRSKTKTEDVFVSQSVHLSRQEAKNLAEEILFRLNDRV
jgi:hypothetical protein